MTSGRVSRDTVFQEIRPGAGFETGDSVKRKEEGATVERLVSYALHQKKLRLLIILVRVAQGHSHE